jgi:hypothetical protein
LVAQIIDFQSQCPNMAQLTPASSLLVQWWPISTQRKYSIDYGQ